LVYLDSPALLFAGCNRAGFFVLYDFIVVITDREDSVSD